MNKQSLQQLELHKLLSIISDFAYSTVAKKQILELKPKKSIEAIRKSLQISSEMQRFVIEFMDIDYSNLTDIEKLLFRFPYENYSFEEFKAIIHTIIASNTFFSKTEELEEENFPIIYEKKKTLSHFPDLQKRYFQIFSPEGKILDTASPKLLAIRKRRQNLRSEIISNLHSKMNDARYESMFQDKIVTMRDDRFVVPIKEPQSRNSDGIIHGVSASRATVYIEPKEIVGKNNEMTSLSEDEKSEIHSIFVQFTKDIQAFSHAIYSNYQQLIELDFFQAIARYANVILATIPTIINEPKIILNEARHPLLIHQLGDRKNVIPFSLKLGFDYNLLIISGPNTGGKTVTLKSVGLLTLMALHGLPIPAKDNSKIGFFEHVFADIGDHQSIEDSLSTFSSHIRSLQTIAEKGNNNTLVLIDEIGSATDPEQGSALAQAMMENITKNKMVGVITTHYTSLKLFAEEHKDCVNAAMQFDPQQHSPTYQFKVGLPGNSFAIEVAEHLGFPASLISRAKELTGNQSIELTEILHKMNEERKKFARYNYHLELKTRLLEMKTKDYEDKIAKFEEEKKELRKKEIKKSQQFLTEMQASLNLKIKELKSTDRKHKRQDAEKILNEVVENNQILEEQKQEISQVEHEKLTNPQVGMMTYVPDFDGIGQIVEVFKREVKVDIDGIFFTVKRNKIRKTNKKKKVFSVASKTISSENKSFRTELKLLGLTFDETVPLIEEFIDDALYNGMTTLRIVHGKGTGVLRAKVRQYFRRNKRVNNFYAPTAEEGGDGVTIIEIK